MVEMKVLENFKIEPSKMKRLLMLPRYLGKSKSAVMRDLIEQALSGTFERPQIPQVFDVLPKSHDFSNIIRTSSSLYLLASDLLEFTSSHDHSSALVSRMTDMHLDTHIVFQKGFNFPETMIDTIFQCSGNAIGFKINEEYQNTPEVETSECSSLKQRMGGYSFSVAKEELFIPFALLADSFAYINPSQALFPDTILVYRNEGYPSVFSYIRRSIIELISSLEPEGEMYFYA